MKIFKYNLNYHSVPELIKLPKDAEVIDFQIQNESFKMWALVDENNEKIDRVFMLVMTGKDIPYEVIKTYGTRIVFPMGVVLHLIELHPSTKANDATTDDRLITNGN